MIKGNTSPKGKVYTTYHGEQMCFGCSHVQPRAGFVVKPTVALQIMLADVYVVVIGTFYRHARVVSVDVVAMGEILFSLHSSVISRNPKSG